MECRESLKVRDYVLGRLAGEPPGPDAAAAALHVGSCASCAALAAEIERVWSRLGEDDGADLAVSPAFAERTAAALAAATRRATNVRRFPVRASESPLLKIAAVLAAGVLGFFLARGTSGGPGPVDHAPSPGFILRWPKHAPFPQHRCNRLARGRRVGASFSFDATLGE